MNDTYIILAAGAGRRTKYIGCKSLLVYKKDTVIGRQIRTIRSVSPHSDIIVVVGFESKKIINHLISREEPVRIVHNMQFSITSQIESLKLAINAALKSNVTIIHGDILFNKEAIEFDSKEKGYLSLDFHNNMLDKSVGAIEQDGIITNLCYGLDQKWGQIAYIPEKHFDNLRKEVNAVKTNMNTYEILNKMMKYLDFHLNDKVKSVMTEIEKL